MKDLSGPSNKSRFLLEPINRFSEVSAGNRRICRYNSTAVTGQVVFTAGSTAQQLLIFGKWITRDDGFQEARLKRGQGPG